MEDKKLNDFSNMWNFSNELLEKNKEAKQKVYSDMPGEDKIAVNINGFIINYFGNIVAKFGFFIETETDDDLELKISPDGFLAKIYNAPTNIIVGYGHPLGFTGMVDIEKSQILHLGPNVSNGDEFVIRVTNDELLQSQGMVILIRDKDVMPELLRDEVRESYLESLQDAKAIVGDLNDIERSFNDYMKHVYTVLSEDYLTKENILETANYE